MEEVKHITGNSEEEVWAQINHDLAANPDTLEYRVLIHQQTREILLDIDIDLGGGFEGGYATTIFSTSLRNRDGFRFALHEEGFFDDLGKFFGMQDVQVGYPDFDKRLVIKTNDEARVRTVFTSAEVREALLSLKDFTFEIVLPDSSDSSSDDSVLELIIEEGITDPVKLRQLYHAFFGVLTLIDPFRL